MSTNFVYEHFVAYAHQIGYEECRWKVDTMAEYAQQIGYEDSEFLVFFKTTINFCIAYDL